MSNFWENRYKVGGNSGAGSYGEYAKYKAEIINNYVQKYEIKTISDFGCGDGNQISLLKGFGSYSGYDISEFIVKKCREKFSDLPMAFFNDINNMPAAELTLSLDVIYHIVDEKEYEKYLSCLFDKSKRFVLIFSSNHDNNNHGAKEYIHHRKFTDWVEKNYKDFKLVEELENFLQTSAKFFLYERIV